MQHSSMTAKWYVLAVATVAFACLSCITGATSPTCAGMEVLVEQYSKRFNEEVQHCAPYLVSKCCEEEGGCSPGRGFDQCYSECLASLKEAGDEVVLQCSTVKRSLFFRRRLRNKGKNRRRRVSKRKRSGRRRKSKNRSRGKSNVSRRRRKKRRSNRGPVSKRVGRRKRVRRRGGRTKRVKRNRRPKTGGRDRDNNDRRGRRRKRRRKRRRDGDGDDDNRREKRKNTRGDRDDEDNERNDYGDDDYDRDDNRGYTDGNGGFGSNEEGNVKYIPGRGYVPVDDSGASTMEDSGISTTPGDTRPGTEAAILALARRKVEELKDYERFVCKSIGTMPKSEFCWMKNGNQREVGGRCKSPKDCLLYEMPLFYPSNQIYTWKHPQGATLEQLKGTAFRGWGLTEDLLEKIQMGAFFDQATSADAYVFVAVPKKATAAFKLEIIHVTTDGFGRITSAIFTRLENKGWLVQPRICGYATESGPGSGTRHCSDRGLNEEEINTAKSTLELHAWKLIIQRLTGADKTCKPDFNCFCYLQKNPKVEQKLGGKATCLNGMFHYLNEGKRQGLDGSCCVKGQSKERPERKAEVTYGECKNWDYDGGAVVTEGIKGENSDRFLHKIRGDSGRGDVGMHCAGIFKCDGDLLWCPAKSCNGGNDYHRGKNYVKNEMSAETQRCASHCVGDRKVDFRRLFTSRDFHGEEVSNDVTEGSGHIRGRLLGKKKKKKKKSISFGGYGSKDAGPGSQQQFGKYGSQKKKSSDSHYPYVNIGRPGMGSSSPWTKSHGRGITKITTRAGVCEAASDGDKGEYKDCMRCMDECSGCKNTCKCSDTDPINKDQMKALGNINRLRDIF